MASRKPFLLRLDPRVHEALQRWARDELRSVNAQIEFVLRDILVREGRLPPPGGGEAPGPVKRSPGGEPPSAPAEPSE